MTMGFVNDLNLLLLVPFACRNYNKLSLPNASGAWIRYDLVL
jgi:hypothetical protein